MRKTFGALCLFITLNVASGCSTAATAPPNTGTGSDVLFIFGSTCNKGQASLYIDDIYIGAIMANGGQ